MRVINLSFEFHREGDMWVGSCKEVGTSSFDKRLGVLQRELLEMTADHLKALEDAGALEDVDD